MFIFRGFTRPSGGVAGFARFQHAHAPRSAFPEGFLGVRRWRNYRRVRSVIKFFMGSHFQLCSFSCVPKKLPVVGARWNESWGQLPDEPTATGGVPTKSSQLGNVHVFPRKGTYSPGSLEPGARGTRVLGGVAPPLGGHPPLAGPRPPLRKQGL